MVKAKTVFGIIFALVVIGLVIAGFIYLPNVFQAEFAGTQCFGGQVLSIQDAQLTYSNELQKDVVRVVFSTVPTSECLDISVSSSELNEKLDEEGYQVTERLTGDIVLTRKEQEYNIVESQARQYRKFNLVNIGGQLFCSDGDCNVANLISSIPDQGTGTPDDCICVGEQTKGVDASFTSSTQLLWETKISVEGSSDLILNNNKLSGKIGNIAFVKWAGNLAGNNQLTRPDMDAYKPFTTNQFRMVEDGTFDILDPIYEDLVPRLVSAGNPGTFQPQPLTEARAYNSNFETRTSNKLSSWISSEPLVKDAVISSNKLIINLNSPVVYPQFTLDIDAKEIGIFISVGEPQVSCPDNFEITSGGTSKEDLIVANIGDNSGSFDYKVSCNKGSSVLQPSPPQTIGASSSKTIQGTFGLTVEEGTETATCLFTATELNSLEEDSCSFSYTSTAQTQCIEGTKTCEQGNTQLWTCLADGSFNKVSCKYGCVVINDVAQCAGGDNGELDCNPIYQVEKESCGFNPLCWVGLEEPKLQCVLATWVYIAIASSILFIIILILLLKGKSSGNYGGMKGGKTIIIKT